MSVFRLIWWTVRGLMTTRTSLIIENLALRQQLVVALRSKKRVKLRRIGRLLWVVLKQIWRDWRTALLIVQPETVCKCTGRAFDCIGGGNRQ